MKRHPWFGFSIALNVVLSALLVGMAAREFNQGSRFKVQGLGSEFESLRPEVRGSAWTSGVAPESRSADLDWVGTLRMAAVSEELIARVAAADFESRWWKRQRELQRQFERGEADEDAVLHFMDQRDIEQEAEMRAVLGEEGFRLWHKEKLLGEFNLAALNLSPSETDALYNLRSQWEREKRALETGRQRGELDGVGFEEQLKTEQNLYASRLKELLGEERYATACESHDDFGQLQRGLRSVNASEAEVAALRSAQQRWDELRAELNGQVREGQLTGEDYEQQIQALDAARNEQLQTVLGHERFVAFQQAQDSRYKTMKRFAPAWSLSDDDIDNLYGTIHGYESAVREYRQRARAMEAQGEPVDWPAVQDILRQFSQQTEQALREYLGNDRFNKLQRSDVLVLSD